MATADLVLSIKRGLVRDKQWDYNQQRMSSDWTVHEAAVEYLNLICRTYNDADAALI